MKTHQGEVVSWDDKKGFGFVAHHHQRVFFHISDLKDPARPNIGDLMSFTLSQDEKGKLRATHLSYAALAFKRQAEFTRDLRYEERDRKRGVNEQKHEAKKAARSIGKGSVSWGVLILLLILPALGMLKAQTEPWGLWVVVVSFIASGAAYYLYWQDKRSALTKEWRVPESTLQAAALLGGWPGALAAQQRFRHKTRKASFLIPFWLIVIAHQVVWFDYAMMSGGLLREIVPQLLQAVLH